MRKLLICAAVVAATAAGSLPLGTPLAQTVAAPAAPARVIVKFRAGASLLRKQALSVAGQQTLQASALGQRIGVALDAGRALSERSHVVIGRGLTSKQLAARIAAESDVEYAVADERKHIVEIPNDPFYLTGPVMTPSNGGPLVGQWYLRPPGVATGAAGSTAPAAINAEQAWDIPGGKGSTSIVVAVLDTGVRFDHPDLLGGNVIAGYDMVRADSPGVFTTANDGNDRDADASDPGDFVTAAESGTLGCGQSSSSWHGTQTLGLIGAVTGNAAGIASVSHGGVRTMPVRVLGKCGGFDSDIQAGILWAAGIHVPGVPDNANPARVINMSLGGSGTCTQGYIDTIGQANAAGAVVVISAGNSGGNGVSNPANCPGAIAVTALRHVGDKVGYSDLGPEITISAPGGNCVNTGGGPCLYPILSTTNKGTTTPIAGPGGAGYTDSFDSSLGTSFSAPLVAGTAALMLSVQPSLTPAQVKAKLQSSARPFPTTGGSAGISTCTPSSTSQDECYCPNPGAGVTALCGAGMLDTRAAVLSAAGVQAVISLSTTTPTAGQAVTLSSTSLAGAGRTIVSTQWTILNAGTTGATITGANNGTTVVVTPTAAGSFVIELTVTDDLGASSTTTLSVAVVSGAVTPPASTPPPAPSGGGGGGGAIDVGWLALLLAAVAALAATLPRARRGDATLSARPSSRRD